MTRPRLGTVLAVAYAALAVAPVVFLSLYSVYEKKGAKFEPALKFDAFSDTLTSSSNLSLLGKTLIIALLAALIATTVAYCVVYCATLITPRLRGTVILIALLALFGGYLVRIFAWRTLLGDEGILATVLAPISLDSVMGSISNSRWAVMLALVNFSIPLAILPIASGFGGMDHRLSDASRDLGAGSTTTFRRITLPLTLRSAALAFSICFILCAGDYVTPALLGGRDGFMFGSLIAQQFTSTLNWPMGAALALVLVFTVAMICFAVISFSGWLGRRLSGRSSTPMPVSQAEGRA